MAATSSQIYFWFLVISTPSHHSIFKKVEVYMQTKLRRVSADG